MTSFYPAFSYVNDITNAKEAVAAFTEDHDFTEGEIVSFRVSPAFGMYEINNKSGKVLSITSDTITVDIESTTWTAFDYSALDTAGTTPPVCVPVGSGVIPYTAEVNLYDAFDNRSN